MSLKDIVIEQATVKVKGKEFKVQGLSLNDIAYLTRDYMEDMVGLYEGKTKIQTVLMKSPDFVAHIIAYAAGEPEEAEKVKNFPIGVQLLALKKVWDLSAVDVDEVGKMVRSLIDSMESINLETPSLESGSKG